MSTTSLPLLDQKTITFSDGSSLELGDAITDFRQCHGALEKRILYHCRRRLPPSASPSMRHRDDEDLIVKIKVQIPDPDGTSTTTTVAAPSPPAKDDVSPEPEPDHSESTMYEFEALRNFAQCYCYHAPRLVVFHTLQQDSDGLLPGGYINFTVMTRVPGISLFELGYWSLEASARGKIMEQFLEALWAIREINIDPLDKGLRNVMWDRETETCGIVDFEMWQSWSSCDEAKDGETAENRLQELQKWGLASRPPAKNWWAEFGIETC